MEDDAGGSAQIVLRLASSGDFRKTRRQVVDIQGTQAEVTADAKVKATAERRGESTVRVGGVEQVGIAMHNAKKRLRERMDTPDMMKRNARAK